MRERERERDDIKKMKNEILNMLGRSEGGEGGGG